MRKAYSKQRRLDSVPIDQVELNLECRDSIIPVLRALQHVYADAALTQKVHDLIGQDVNGNSRTDCGREGMDYWHLLVLSSVRLGCNLTYDQLHDLSEKGGFVKRGYQRASCGVMQVVWWKSSSALPALIQARRRIMVSAFSRSQ